MQHLGKGLSGIIKAGKAEGISLSKSYVSKVLSTRPRSRVIAAPGQRGAGQDPLRVEFRQLVLRIGTERAREWLAALDKTSIPL